MGDLEFELDSDASTDNLDLDGDFDLDLGADEIAEEIEEDVEEDFDLELSDDAIEDPIVGVGSTLGAWVGSKAASELFAIFDPAAAPYRLMLIAAAGLGACILLSNIINTRSARTADSRQAEKAAKPLGKEGGFKLVFSNRYLLLIAFLILLLNVVNTTGEFILGKVVTEQTTEAVAAQQLAPEQQEAEIKQRIGVFYGDFFSYVNLLTFLMQSFLVSRLFKWIGVRGALFILPCIALGSYSLILTVPILGIIRIAKILENSTDYSIMNTTRHALFLPTSREAKYKAKAAIDTFFWRVGDMLQAGVVFVGTSLAFGTSQFALVNVGFVVIWLVIVVAIRREHKKISAEEEALPAAA
jgi:AAA family ATP:ADP antiporter